MDVFFEPFLSLHQIVGWAETRNPEALRLGANANESFLGCLSDFRRLAIKRLVDTGDDVNEWLWDKSGWDKDDALKGLNNQLHPYVLWIEGKERDAEKYRNKSRPFPTLRYLEFLFRTGELKATANLPGNPMAYEMTQADWGGLVITTGGSRERLGVWSAETAGEGAQAFENVRVRREDILRAFPAERSQELKDDLSREAMGANPNALIVQWPATSQPTSQPRRLKAKVDWQVAEDLLRLECNRRGGVPGPDMDLDWRIQADAERFVADALANRRETAAESVVREHTKKMLRELRDGIGRESITGLLRPIPASSGRQ